MSRRKPDPARPPDEKITLRFRLPRYVVDRLSAVAQEHDLTMSLLVEAALGEFFADIDDPDRRPIRRGVGSR